METLNLQTLVSETGQALMAAGASDYYQRIFKTLGKQLLAYARIHETDVFSIDFGLQFLEEHYHMSEKVAAKKWPVIYSRCINFLSDYQRTGHIVLCFGVTKKAYTVRKDSRKARTNTLITAKRSASAIKQTSCPFFILNAFLLSWMGKEFIRLAASRSRMSTVSLSTLGQWKNLLSVPTCALYGTT